MANIPPSIYNNTPGGAQMNINPGHSALNHNQQLNQVPLGHLPPGYTGLKQDNNSNTPHSMTTPQNNALGQMQNMNNYNQSGNSSPAFNHSGMLPPQSTSLQSSPMKPPINPTISMPSQPGDMPKNNSMSIQRQPTMPPSSVTQNIPTAGPFHNPLQGQLPPSASIQSQAKGVQYPNLSPVPMPLTSASSLINNSPIPYHPNHPPQQINNNAPLLTTTSQYNQPNVRGPPGPPTSAIPQPSNPFSPTNAFNTPSAVNRPPISASIPGIVSQGIQVQQPTSGNSLLTQLGQPAPTNRPQLNQMTNGPAGLSYMGPQRPMGMNGPVNSFAPPTMAQPSSNSPGPVTVAPGPISRPTGPPMNLPPVGPQMPGLLHTGMVNGPGSHQNSISGPMGPPTLPMGQPQVPMGGHQGHMGLPSGPLLPSGGTMGPALGPMGPPVRPIGPPSGPIGQQQGALGPPSGLGIGPQSLPAGLPSGPQSLPPMSQQIGPPKTNMQNRYPQVPACNYGLPPMQQPGVARQQPQQYNAQNLTQQMGQMSVTKQGFDQLWGHQMLDLMQCRQIIPEYPEEPPEIRLAQFPEASNCSPEVFRCTVNKIPDTNSLLQKSRLPLGILIHPFKDLNHLPVIQCNTIVRCRACRTYINPFAYFVDNKRWKCNLCYRVNDLPEEFQYDPVSKSYGDPSRRPEIKSATIEFIAPGEYMLRPPQPAVYLFLMDVSQIGRDSGYLKLMCDTLLACLDQLPGDSRTQVGFICYDAHLHYYLMHDQLTRPKELTVIDIDDVFLPSPESLLVNLGEMKERVVELLSTLAPRHASPAAPAASALGAALQAAYKLMAPTGGRVTVFQTCLPNVGPGALQPREDPNARSSKEVNHLNPATDFYKRIALDCSGAQVAVDLFLLSSQYSDLATLSGMSKFSGGSIYHIPLFRADRPRQAEEFRRMFTRYLTRKIGFEAVMRVRCTRGISIHTFHGNFFVRSTDLLSLPNVSPDLGFGMQLSIDESLSDLQHVCFQAALLYTTSKGERRIRVHTLALPIASNLTDVLHSADQQCIIGLLAKMAVDRCVSASMSEAREALMTVAVDTLSAHRLAQNLPPAALAPALHAPAALRLLPLYLLALLKRKAFRTGTSTRLDERVADMCGMKCLPLQQLLRAVYPDLYALHRLHAAPDRAPDPPRLHLSAERLSMNGAYLLDDGETMIIYVCHGISPAFLSDAFGVTAFSQLSDELTQLPHLDTDASELLHAFLDKLNEDRPYASNIMLLRDNSPNKGLFTERLVDDRVESAFSYYEFLQHVKTQVK